MFLYPLVGLIAYEQYELILKYKHLLALLFFTLPIFTITTYFNFTYIILMVLYLLLLKVDYSKKVEYALKLLGIAVILIYFRFNQLNFFEITFK